MPLDDDGAFDPLGEAFSPAPHPDDRLWRHPSELRKVAPPSALNRPITPAQDPSTATGRRSGRGWTLALLAASGGAAVSAGVLIALGIPERIVERTVTQQVAVTPTTRPALSPIVENNDDPGILRADPPDRPRTAAEQAVVSVAGAGDHGSGVVIRDDGTVLTSAAVVGGGPDQPVVVTLGDGRQLEADVQGTDQLTDVAVVRLPVDEYPSAVLADVSQPGGATPRDGTSLSVIWSLPDGSSQRIDGVLASSTWTMTRPDHQQLDGLLQVRTGSSSVAPGGPVVDERDVVVGMTTHAGRDWSYAVPIDVVDRVANDLIETGEAQHAWLGIQGFDAAAAEPASIAASQPEEPAPDGPPDNGAGPGVATAGVLVDSVAADGPADDYLVPGDVIVDCGGTPVPNMAALQALLLRHRAGDPLEVTFYRPGEAEPSTATITLGHRP